MAKQKRKWVAFKGNSLVPGDVMGKVEDQKMQAGEPVLLPEGYANHVVHDGFAAFCAAPQKDVQKSPVVQSVEQGLDVAKTEALKAAQARVDELNAKLAQISEDDTDWDILSGELVEAEAALAALQPAS